MRSIAAFCLSFAASAFAYTVITPSTSAGWTNSGPQPCTWQRVDSDRLNFTALLVNQDFSVRQILSALVDGTLEQVTLSPPNLGWPTGQGFRLNFVQDTENLNAILAQSSQFSILPPNSTTSSSTTPIVASTVVVQSSTAINNPTSTTANTTPPTTNAASPAMSVQSGLLSILAVMGFVLA